MIGSRFPLVAPMRTFRGEGEAAANRAQTQCGQSLQQFATVHGFLPNIR